MKRILQLLIYGVSAFILYGCALPKIDIVEEGSGYGFTIGQEKPETFELALNLFKGKELRMFKAQAGACANGSGGRLVIIVLSDSCMKYLMEQDMWEFHYGNNPLDFLRLSFENGVLSQIYRHRHFIEAP